MPEVTVFAWNPRAPWGHGRITRRIPRLSRTNNFGDLLGPIVVAAMRSRLGIADAPAARDAQLFSVGSVIHAAPPRAVIWGSGVNGRYAPEDHRFTDLDIRAVRGPVSRSVLTGVGMKVPEIYGDPALLLPRFRPDLCDMAKRHDVTAIPNLNEAHTPMWRSVRESRGINYVDPRSPLEHVLRDIVSSRLVVGSSLHAVIVAEAFGIPARLVASAVEPDLKYRDYYAGTGRENFEVAETPDAALRLGGERPLSWDPEPLLASFPSDLWARPERT